MSEALAMADNQRERWPFKYVNGTLTSISEALERDKGAHKASKPDISNIEDALL